jgi:hypothetical protein
MRRVIACMAAVAWVLLGAGSAAATSAPFVTGSGKGPFPLAPESGEVVQLEVTARQLPNGSFQGRFNAHHFLPGGEMPGLLQGELTCLAVNGNVATMTGLATHGKLFGVELEPFEVAITIIDNGAHDLFAIEVAFDPFPHDITPCQLAHSAFASSEEGNFIVHD